MARHHISHALDMLKDTDPETSSEAGVSALEYLVFARYTIENAIKAYCEK